MPRTYEPIASVSLTSSASSINFNSIASTWTDLVVVLSALATSQEEAYVRLNGDSGSTYSLTFLYGNGSSAASSRLSNWAGGANLGYMNTTSPTPFIIHVMSYASTNVKKSILASSADPVLWVTRRAILWNSTAAVTAVNLIGSFASGTTATLYGIKAA